MAVSVIDWAAGSSLPSESNVITYLSADNSTVLPAEPVAIFSIAVSTYVPSAKFSCPTIVSVDVDGFQDNLLPNEKLEPEST